MALSVPSRGSLIQIYPKSSCSSINNLNSSSMRKVWKLSYRQGDQRSGKRKLLTPSNRFVIPAIAMDATINCKTLNAWQLSVRSEAIGFEIVS